MPRLGSVIWNVTRIDSANLHVLTATPNMAHAERSSASFFCTAMPGMALASRIVSFMES